MTVVDLHPEDLLDKDARGQLTSDERVRLEAHLSRCSACRAEQLLRADFAAELDGEDERPSALLGLVQGALASKPSPLPPAAAEIASDDVPGRSDQLAAVGVGRRPRARRLTVFLLVAAAVLAAGAAGATGVTGRVWLRLRGDGPEATHATATATAAPPATPAANRVATGARQPNPLEPAIPAVDAARDPALADAPAPSPLPLPLPSRSPSPSLANAPSAAALFESANAARRAGDVTTALARYDTLETQFAGSREARLAKATAGRLLLDRGEPARALRHFDAYLASGSTELREEAMAGRATSLERLGRTEEESRAWATLLATYPGTAYASHAKARAAAGAARGSSPQ